MSRVGCLSAALALAIAAAACADDGSSESTAVSTTADTTVETPTASDSPSETGPIDVTVDVRFAEASPDLVRWSDPLLDVYSPPGGDNLPLVVMLPPHSLTKQNSATVQLANSVAQQGAVVAVVNWSELENPPEAYEDPALLTGIARAGQSVADCAVSFAASRAGEYSADPSRLVLVGELYGANAASMVALGTADPLPGCRTPDTGWGVTGLIGVNADWLVTAPFFDNVASAAVGAFSPWTLLDQAPMIPTRLVVTPAGATVGTRCDDPGADWMTLRDPTGTMREQLDAVGGFDDGCIDLGDEAKATAEEMSARGLPADVVWLTNSDAATRSGSGGQVLEFGQADLDLLVDTIIDTAQISDS